VLDYARFLDYTGHLLDEKNQKSLINQASTGSQVSWAKNGLKTILKAQLRWCGLNNLNCFLRWRNCEGLSVPDSEKPIAARFGI